MQSVVAVTDGRWQTTEASRALGDEYHKTKAV